VVTWALPARPIRGGGCRRPQGHPIQSWLQCMSHGAGGAAREARWDRRSKGCCGPRFGVATCIPLRPAICGPGQCANAIRLSKRGPPRCRIAGITPQISGCALVSECERRLLARLGHSKITDELPLSGEELSCSGHGCNDLVLPEPDRPRRLAEALSARLLEKGERLSRCRGHGTSDVGRRSTFARPN